MYTCPNCRAQLGKGYSQCHYCGATMQPTYATAWTPRSQDRPAGSTKESRGFAVPFVAGLVVGLLVGSGATALVLTVPRGGGAGRSGMSAESSPSPETVTTGPDGDGGAGAARGAGGGADAPDQAGVDPYEADREAMRLLRNALVAAKVYYVDAIVYTTDPSSLSSVEPSVSWVPSATVAPTTCLAARHEVCVAVTDLGSEPAQAVGMGTYSASGTAYYIGDIARGPFAGTYYACSRGGRPLDISVLPDRVQGSIQHYRGWEEC